MHLQLELLLEPYTLNSKTYTLNQLLATNLKLQTQKQRPTTYYRALNNQNRIAVHIDRKKRTKQKKAVLLIMHVSKLRILLTQISISANL